MTHHQALHFKFYRYSEEEDYHDYYDITLLAALGGFPIGTRFEAGSEAPDGSIYARKDGLLHYLTNVKHGADLPLKEASSFIEQNSNSLVILGRR